MKSIQREILLGFWKIHILHHAAEGPVVGQWMLQELRRHGYDLSPGTLYPILHRMEQLGWLRCEGDHPKGSRTRKEYSLTVKGQEILTLLRKQVEELYEEVILEEKELEKQP